MTHESIFDVLLPKSRACIAILNCGDGARKSGERERGERKIWRRRREDGRQETGVLLVSV